jgi:hypothetical protein
MKGKENSQTICWRIEKHGFIQDLKTFLGNTWKVLRFRVGAVYSEARTVVGRWEVFRFQQVLTSEDTERQRKGQYRQNCFLNSVNFV